MLKKPGAFSQKYIISNMPNRQSLLSGNQNKENKNLNGTFDEYDSDLLISKPMKHLYNSQKSRPSVHKMKEEYQKKQKQLLAQLNKAKKQLSKTREQNKSLHAQNQEIICKYEQYMKDLAHEKDQIQSKLQQLKLKYSSYREHLQYSVLWLIEIFSIGLNHQRQLIDKYLNKEKFAQLFHRLNPIVEELQIQEQLKNLCGKNSSNSDADTYLLMGNNQFSIESSIHEVNLQPQFPTLLDTFDFRKGYEEGQSNQEKQLARKLFDSPQTDRANNQENSDQFLKPRIKLQINSQSTHQPNDVLQINQNYNPVDEDYLSLKKGAKIKLLRKVGEQLWIVELGDQIGYIEASCLN